MFSATGSQDGYNKISQIKQDARSLFDLGLWSKQKKKKIKAA